MVNRKLNSHRLGFTLAELLVVIGIIAILLAILMPTLTAAFKSGDKAKAKLEMANIVSAVKAYYKEYGVMPTTGYGNEDSTYSDKSAAQQQNEVMDILRAQDTVNNPGNQYNSRQIAFLEVPPDAMEGTDRNGLSYTFGEGYYLDPWGNPYAICMDMDVDGEVGISGLDAAAMSLVTALSPDNDAVIPGVTVAVMSYGSDPTDTNEFLVSWGRR